MVLFDSYENRCISLRAVKTNMAALKKKKLLHSFRCSQLELRCFGKNCCILLAAILFALGFVF